MNFEKLDIKSIISDRSNLKQLIEKLKSSILEKLYVQKSEKPSITVYHIQEIPYFIELIYFLWNALNLDLKYFNTSNLEEYFYWPTRTQIELIKSTFPDRRETFERKIFEFSQNIEDYSFMIAVISILYIIFGFDVDIAFPKSHDADEFRSKYIDLFFKLDFEEFINIESIKKVALADYFAVNEIHFGLRDFSIEKSKENKKTWSMPRPKVLIIYEVESLLNQNFLGKTKPLNMKIYSEQFEKFIKSLGGKFLSRSFDETICKTEEGKAFIKSIDESAPSLKETLINNMKRAVFEISELKSTSLRDPFFKQNYSYFPNNKYEITNEKLSIKLSIGNLNYLDFIKSNTFVLGFCKNLNNFSTEEEILLKSIFNYSLATKLVQTNFSTANLNKTSVFKDFVSYEENAWSAEVIKNIQQLSSVRSAPSRLGADGSEVKKSRAESRYILAEPSRSR